MEKNPADEIKSTMWSFLMSKGQKANVPALKDAVYDLIKMTTQKTAGQRAVKKDIDWSKAGMTMMSIVIEASWMKKENGFRWARDCQNLVNMS